MSIFRVNYRRGNTVDIWRRNKEISKGGNGDSQMAESKGEENSTTPTDSSVTTAGLR